MQIIHKTRLSIIKFPFKYQSDQQYNIGLTSIKFVRSTKLSAQVSIWGKYSSYVYCGKDVNLINVLKPINKFDVTTEVHIYYVKCICKY